MKTLNKIVTLVLLIVLLGGCAKIYKSKNMLTQIHKHKVIAVLPTQLTFKEPEKPDNEVRDDIIGVEGMDFQLRIYYFLLSRKKREEIAVEVLDLATTNDRLGKIDYNADESVTSSSEIAVLLGVDSVIKPHVKVDWGKRTSYPGYGKCRPVCINLILEIYDSETQEVIWGFSGKRNNNIACYAPFLQDMLDDLLESSTRKIPYIINSK